MAHMPTDPHASPPSRLSAAREQEIRHSIGLTAEEQRRDVDNLLTELTALRQEAAEAKEATDEARASYEACHVSLVEWQDCFREARDGRTKAEQELAATKAKIGAAIDSLENARRPGYRIKRALMKALHNITIRETRAR